MSTLDPVLVLVALEECPACHAFAPIWAQVKKMVSEKKLPVRTYEHVFSRSTVSQEIPPLFREIRGVPHICMVNADDYIYLCVEDKPLVHSSTMYTGNRGSLEAFVSWIQETSSQIKTTRVIAPDAMLPTHPSTIEIAASTSKPVDTGAFNFKTKRR